MMCYEVANNHLVITPTEDDASKTAKLQPVTYTQCFEIFVYDAGQSGRVNVLPALPPPKGHYETQCENYTIWVEDGTGGGGGTAPGGGDDDCNDGTIITTAKAPPSDCGGEPGWEPYPTGPTPEPDPC